MADISLELINAMGSLRDSVGALGTTASNYINVTLPDVHRREKETFKKLTALNTQIGKLATQLTLLNKGQGSSTGGGLNILTKSTKDFDDATKAMTTSLWKTVTEFDRKINPALSNIAGQLTTIFGNLNNRLAAQSAASGGSRGGGNNQALPVNHPNHPGNLLDQAIKTAVMGLIGGRLGADIVTAANRSMETTIDMQVAGTQKMQIGVKEWMNIVQDHKIAMRATTGGLDTYTETITQYAKQNKELFGNDRKLAAESIAQLDAMVKQQSGVVVSTARMKKELSSFSSLFAKGAEITGETVAQQIRATAAMAESTEVQELLMHTEASRRIEVLKDLAATRQHAQVMGLSADKATEYAKALAKASGTTAKERLVGGAMAANAATSLGLSPEISRQLMYVFQHGGIKTDKDREAVQAFEQKKMDYKTAIKEADDASAVARESGDQQQADAWAQRSGTLQRQLDIANDIWGRGGISDAMNKQFDAERDKIMKKGLVNPERPETNKSENIIDRVTTSIFTKLTTLGTEMFRTIDKFLGGNSVYIATSLASILAIRAQIAALGANTAAVTANTLGRNAGLPPGSPGGTPPGRRGTRVQRAGRAVAKASRGWLGKGLFAAGMVYEGYSAIGELNENQKERKEGVISEKEENKRGGKLVGGLAGGGAAAAIGMGVAQVLIPIPFLGAAIGLGVGSVIGGVIGSEVGGAIGEQFGKEKPEKDVVIVEKSQEKKQTPEAITVEKNTPKTLKEMAVQNNKTEAAKKGEAITSKIESDTKLTDEQKVKLLATIPGVKAYVALGKDSEFSQAATVTQEEKTKLMKKIPGVAPYVALGNDTEFTAPTTSLSDDQKIGLLYGMPVIGPIIGSIYSFAKSFDVSQSLPTLSKEQKAKLLTALPIVGPSIGMLMSLGDMFGGSTPSTTISSSLGEIPNVQQQQADMIAQQQIDIKERMLLNVSEVPTATINSPTPPMVNTLELQNKEPPVENTTQTPTVSDDSTQLEVNRKSNKESTQDTQSDMLTLLTKQLKAQQSISDSLTAMVQAYIEKENDRKLDQKLFSLNKSDGKTPSGIRTA